MFENIPFDFGPIEVEDIVPYGTFYRFRTPPGKPHSYVQTTLYDDFLNYLKAHPNQEVPSINPMPHPNLKVKYGVKGNLPYFTIEDLPNNRFLTINMETYKNFVTQSAEKILKDDIKEPGNV